MSGEAWLRTHASLVIRKAPTMTAAQRGAVAHWLREQAELVEQRAAEMGELYCPRFMHGDELPFDDKEAHLRAARDHENAYRRSTNRIERKA